MNKKVLLISHRFYDYHNVIKKGIERLGYDCDGYCFTYGFFFKLFNIIPCFGRLATIVRDNHFRRHILNYSNPYDVVIVIKGSALSPRNHEMLRKLNPSAKFSLYIWDDVAQDKGELAIRYYYDKVFSYSPIDCKEYGMIYRPMFYDDTMDNTAVEKDIDIFYIATYRKNRLGFIDKVVANTKPYGLKYKIIVRNSLHRFVFHLGNLRHWCYFKFRNVSYGEMFSYLKRSKCSVELCPPGQKALTTRSFEAIHTKTKIITTNPLIKNCDYYNPDNVLVVDEQNPIIPEGWIRTPFREIGEGVLNRYSLDSFCRELLSNDC